MSGTKQQRAAFAFLRGRHRRPFSAPDLAAATGYKQSTAGTHLSEHWATVVQRDGSGWRARSVLSRMTLDEFLREISQGKRARGATTSRRSLIIDASAIVPYYVRSATNNAKLRRRIRALLDSVRDGSNSSFLYMPSFCIAEAFSVFMKHRFSGWNANVKKKIPDRAYKAAVEGFEADIHNGKLIYQCELNRYHVLGINLVAPVDHHYQIRRPRARLGKKKPRVTPAGTFDQLIVSVGVQLAHQHGAANTIIVTADARLAALAEKCRRPMKPDVVRKLGLDRCEQIVGRPFRPETFPNVIDLQRAARHRASSFVGCDLPI